MREKEIDIVSKLTSRQKWETYLAIACTALSVAVLAFAILSLFSFTIIKVFTIAFLIGICVAAWGAYQVRPRTGNEVVIYLDRHYSALQDSTDLLLKAPENLNQLEALQREKVEHVLASILPGVRIPTMLTPAVFWLILSLCIAIPLVILPEGASDRTEESGQIEKSDSNDSAPPPAGFKEITVTVVPPSYTQLPTKTQQDFPIVAPEGSKITWSMVIEGATSATLILGANDSIPINPSGVPTSITVQRNTFYHIRWSTPYTSDATAYYGIEVTPDKPAQIKVSGLRQFTEVNTNEKQSIPLVAGLEDDYGVKDAYIIATVSKGSGESVKFREERLRFTSPRSFGRKAETAKQTLDLEKLGLDPGDELYFYIEAIDNRQPTANISRTETFFIQVPDTATQEISFEGGLGVNVMPEYFRSQRQIIIESEQLVRDRKRIPKQSFNAKSNELAFDQKVLRLKYGEFLGEEFETQIGPTHDHEETLSQEEKPIEEEFGHVHDKENEDHTPEAELPSRKSESAESVTAPYTHSHDDPEEATFFVQSIRTRLKAALTYMWDAELHLRVYSPEESLPYQYKALKLLKEISNESRIYVHRTGFDPPPLKEEKRLTGDLKEVQSRRFTASKSITPEDEIRKGIKILQEKLFSDAVLNPSERIQLHKTGNELASRALTSPGKFLDALTLLKQLSDEKLPKNDQSRIMVDLLRLLWRELPIEYFEPSEKTQSIHLLDAEFVKQFQARRTE